MELSVLWLLNVDEHHEFVGEEHVIFAFDSDVLSEIFSQAVHETFGCIVVVLLVMCVALRFHCHIAGLHALDGEQQTQIEC